MKVPLYRHNLHGADIDALGEEFKQVLRGMVLSTGSVCEEMQTEFAKALEIEHCLLTNNWTNATIATLLALGIGPGDEVIIPALTFSATANAIEAVGATPVLIDVDAKTHLMKIPDVTMATTDRTKAIMPVHLYGQMVDIEALQLYASPHLFILEDAAHAIEATHRHKRPGHFSDAAMFSFYTSKNITTGEGGALITNNEELLEKVRIIYRHGISSDGYKLMKTDKWQMPEQVTQGIKGNMSDLTALLLRPQLANLSQSHAKRTAHAKRYLRELKGLPITLPFVDPGGVHAWHIFAIGVDSNMRPSIISMLDEMGIRTAVQFKPIHHQQYYGEKYGWDPRLFPNASKWGASTLSLPVFADMTDDEQTYVIDCLRLVLSRLGYEVLF